MPKQPLYEMPFAPPQGISHEVNASTPLQRGTSPLEIWYSGAANQTAYVAGASFAVNTVRAYPIVIGRTGILDRIGFEPTGASAGSVGRVALYSAISATNLYPGSLLVESGELDTSSAAVKTATISTYISPGLYWFAFVFGTAVATMRRTATGGGLPLLGVPSTMGANCNQRLTGSLTYGAFASTFPAGIAAIDASAVAPVGHIRFSS